jgi:orotidine-5'-phosphate decarboxylase
VVGAAADPGADPGTDGRARGIAHRGAVTESYLARLASRSSAVRTVLCVGIDPTPETLPVGWPTGLPGIERLARLIVEAAAPHAAALKPNLAFFEAYGSAGIAALERVLAARPPGVLVVADAKRADVETTSVRQAVALFDGLGADAVTVNPYLGLGALEAFLERLDRFAYVLCRTSNRGAGELQDLVVAADASLGAPAEALHLRVARRVAAAGIGERAGLVVGATAPAELSGIRALVPGLAVLVPGVGTQGGDSAPVLSAGPATGKPAGGRAGGGLLVNVSRGIAMAAARSGHDGRSADPGERLAEAARNWAATLAVIS